MASITQLSACDLKKSLEVIHPYLALKQVIDYGDGKLSAQINPEQPLYQEDAIIAASEVGRHLALLGAIAVSRQNPKTGRHFYLATDAELKTLCEPQAHNIALLGIAEESTLEGKTASARCLIVDRANPSRVLYELTTEYQILSERLFARMFKQHFDKHPHVHESGHSPYARHQPIAVETLTDDYCCSPPTLVKAEECLGHFPNYPSLPVAILMGRLAQMASRLLSERVPGAKHYKLLEASIKANQLAFAGQHLRFEAHHEGSSGDLHTFKCRVMNNDDVTFGEMRAVLSPTFGQDGINK